ncbi:MAG: DUF3575 domain-containing protein [Rikenellaceae bacterium]|jgi:hypothetical protein|nr:DUF3575 domain-containing protein [Rikenellaceae bacterium]
MMKIFNREFGTIGLLRALVLPLFCIAVVTSRASAQSDAVRMSAENGGYDTVGVVTVDFRLNSSVLIRDYKDNASALERLDLLFQDRKLLSTLDYVVITAGTSPEGDTSVNEKLSQARALALKSYLVWKFPSLDKDIIQTFSAGEDWAGLRREVESDPRVPSQSEVLALLDSSQSNEAKKAALRQIADGSAYTYIVQHILPRLRVGTTLFLRVKPTVKPQPAPKPEKEVVVVKESEVAEKKETNAVHVDRTIEPQSVEPAQPVVIEEPVERAKNLSFALKTNLLFDLGTAINIEAEVPIGKRWSVAGEWIFPWWLIESDQIALQTGVATLEARRWLGNRENKQLLTGWFLGAHGGWGYYDLEWKDKGSQGELWYGGLSGGYAHTISKNGHWRMEYSLGLGYMHTDYTGYIPEKDDEGNLHLVRQKEAKRDYFGPTRAKVSLVWMFNRNSKKRGGAQ